MNLISIISLDNWFKTFFLSSKPFVLQTRTSKHTFTSSHLHRIRVDKI